MFAQGPVYVVDRSSVTALTTLDLIRRDIQSTDSASTSKIRNEANEYSGVAVPEEPRLVSVSMLAGGYVKISPDYHRNLSIVSEGQTLQYGIVITNLAEECRSRSMRKSLMPMGSIRHWEVTTAYSEISYMKQMCSSRLT